MSLRSGKFKKRHVKSSSYEYESDEDIISKLPNELLTQILSLLPEYEANRTRVLSKRWKHLSSFLAYLHVAMPVCLSTEQRNKFYNSVDQILVIRDGMVTQRFILHWTLKCDYNRLYNWLRIIIQCKVREIELWFPDDVGYRARVRFRWDLFKACNTLIELTLNGGFMVNVPEGVLFPCLKKLVLVSVLGLSDQSVKNLILGCPILEELIMERQNVNLQFEIVDTCKVSSQSLKILRIVVSRNWFNKVVIDAPNLEYLYVTDDKHIDYYIIKPLSLVEAHISSCSFNVVRLLTGIASAKILTMTCLTILSLAGVLSFPVFPNLVKLVIGIDYIWHETLLLALLNNMPNVEHITFLNVRREKLYGAMWREPRKPPACMRLKMKVVIMEDMESVRDEDLPFIRYLLKHSEYVERLTITVRKIDPHRREELLNFPRGSSLCRVELI